MSKHNLRCTCPEAQQEWLVDPPHQSSSLRPGVCRSSNLEPKRQKDCEIVIDQHGPLLQMIIEIKNKAFSMNIQANALIQSSRGKGEWG